MKRRTLLAVSMAAVPALRAAETGWDELVRQSVDYTERTQQALQERYELSKHERWNVDQDKGELVFSNAGVPAVTARFQFVGSVSLVAGTWLWSWANSSIERQLSKDMEVVRRHGEKHGFKKLTDRKWNAEEADAWEMAAIANYLLKAKGVYRMPYEKLYAFAVLTDLRRAGRG